MERREVLRWLVVAGGAGAVGALAPDELLAFGARVQARVGAGGAPRVLTPAQRATAAAAMEVILPRTDTPGATDARTVEFLETLLEGWLTPSERERIVGGLDDLDARARAAHRAPFTRLASGAQTALLTALDAEVEAARRGRPAATARGAGALVDAAGMHWFAALRTITVLGWATSQVAMERALGAWPLPGRYDADAPVKLRRAPRAAAGGAAHTHGAEAAR